MKGFLNFADINFVVVLFGHVKLKVTKIVFSADDERQSSEIIYMV